jgi:methylsterol monooxygenase/4-alpha-methyl-delta7-sterol-4alpha-methyl oxidase
MIETNPTEGNIFKPSVLAEKSHGFISFRLLPHFSSCIILLVSLYYISQLFFLYTCPDHPSTMDLVNLMSLKVGSLALLLIYGYYYLLYRYQFPFMEQFKINNLPWPWESNPETWSVYIKDAIKTAFFNQIVIFPVILVFFMAYFRPNTDPAAIPNFATFLFHGLIMTFTEDFSFYWCHRFLHLPFFYKRIHKKHHKHFNIINISSVYTHWAEFALGNAVCMLAGMMVLHGHLHVVTLNAFAVFRLIETNEAHCGYDFPWSPFKVFPFSTDSAYHNYHHLKNMGNYGSFFSIWDTIFKTNQDFNDEIAREQNHSKSLIQGRWSY